MAESDLQTLRSSEDPRILKRAAVSLAASRDPDEVAFLGVELASGTLVQNLDAPEAYQRTWRHLRLTRVIKTLMDSDVPAADEVLVLLTLSEPFKSHTLRIQLLINALSVVRPLRPEGQRFLQTYGRPRNPLAYDVVTALVINQSPEAMSLLEEILISEGHPLHLKAAWAQQLIMPRRHDVPILQACENVLRHPETDSAFQASLIEALFDYQPDGWFRDCHPPEPPEISQAGGDARALLRGIGLFALQGDIPLSEEQQMAVQDGLTSLDA